jgi:D-alanine-D-alanine ligase-like ATP-grasp enzyme
VAEGAILSLEEKFQGGTGVNITPPPENLISTQAIRKARKNLELLATQLGIHGYARIDTFIERTTGNIKVIEVNTLPGLTASTVLFHQALAEPIPLYPKEFLEMIIRIS